jgi:hypothetical protein
MRWLLPASCCVLAPLAAAQEVWESRLPDLAPALRACLLAAPAGSAVVLAWPMNHGQAGALLRLPAGGREECVADAMTGAIALRRTVPEAERRSGEDERRFTLERGCVDARRVDGKDGAVLGWLGYPGCG